jgi:hypothetical protein
VVSRIPLTLPLKCGAVKLFEMEIVQALASVDYRMDHFSYLMITAIGWSLAKLRGATSTDSIPYWFAKTTSVNTLSPARGIVTINGLDGRQQNDRRRKNRELSKGSESAIQDI